MTSSTAKTGAAPDFEWARIPAEIRRAFARALDGGRPSDDTALRVLAERCAVPGEAFFRDAKVIETALKDWLPVDPVALGYVYAVGSADPPRGRTDNDRVRLSRLRKQNKTPKLRAALAEALLAAGGRIADVAGVDALRSYLLVPTSGPDPKPLFPFQRDVLEEVRSHTHRDARPPHGLIVMPTGSGKTKTAVWWLMEDALSAGKKVLWITHRKELLEQSALAFVEAASLLRGRQDALRMRLVGGGFGAGRATTIAEPDYDVAVATIGSLSRNLPAVEKLLQREDVVVVVDEAHHSTARTWRRIVELAQETNDAVVGLTATPTRMVEEERRDLSGLYSGRVLARADMRELINARYLAQPLPQRVETLVPADVDITRADLDYLARFGELSPRMAMGLAKNAPRNKTIVETWLKGPGEGRTYGQTIAFAVSVAHAIVLAEAFQAVRVEADWISHTRPERHDLIEKFRRGELDVLVNVEILTEGVDLPKVETVLLCRPTQSEVLMSQMIGRAMRGPEVGGTESAYLVSFRDHWEQFTQWLDPIDLLPPEIIDPPTAPPAPPTVQVPLPIELIRRAAAEAVERWPAEVGQTYDTIPAAWYAFELEVELPDGEIEARRHTVFVAQHQLGGFDAMGTRALRDKGQLDTDAVALQAEFFGEVADPRPAEEHLALLARFAREHGQLPPRRAIEAREHVAPRHLAEQIIEQDLRLTERRELIAKARDAAPELVDGFWGGTERFATEVLQLAGFYEARGQWPLDIERHGPYLRGADRVDYSWGDGVRDLDQAFERVTADRDLFPVSLEPPAGGIGWAQRLSVSAWGLYEPDEEAITISPLLDSDEAPDYVLEFLVFHELLHHEDKLRDWTGLPHGGDFRQRERRFARHVEAEGWLDAWEERYHRLENPGPAGPAAL